MGGSTTKQKSVQATGNLGKSLEIRGLSGESKSLCIGDVKSRAVAKKNGKSHVWLYSWGFPEIGVPLNHPVFYRIFPDKHDKPSIKWVPPPFMEPPYQTLEFCDIWWMISNCHLRLIGDDPYLISLILGYDDVITTFPCHDYFPHHAIPSGNLT